MKKVLIFSFFCSLFFTVSFAQKVKPVNYGGSVNLIEVRGRGYDAVLVLRTLGYGKNDALAQEDAEVRVIRALLYSGFSKDYPAVISMSETEAETLFVSAYFNSENEKQHPDQYGNDIVDSAQIFSS